MVKTIINKINREIVKNDELRRKINNQKGTILFRKTYSKKYDFPNLNTGAYWDEIFRDDGGLAAQSPMTKDKIKTIASLIPNKPLTIIDIGIGQGYLEEILKTRPTNYKLLGIDISPLAIKRAKKLFGGKFTVGNVLDIDKHYSEKSADIMVALELLEHINPSQLFILYKKIHSILTNNGKFIISIPINEHLEKMETNPSAHVRDYSADLIEAELKLNGFEIEEKITLSAFGSSYRLKKLISKIVHIWEPNSLIVVAKKQV